MNCQQAQTELSAYIDNELPPPTRAEVESHLQGCASCRTHLTELRKLTRGVGALPKPQPASQFLAAVRRKIAREETRERRDWIDTLFRPAWVKVPIEALAVVAVLAVAIVLIAPPQRRVEQRVAAAPAAPPVATGLETESRAERELAKETAEPEAKRKEAFTTAAKASAQARREGGAAPTFGLAAPASNGKHDEQTPAEVIVIQAKDSATALAQVTIVTSGVGGRVQTTKQTGGAVQSVFVELPVEEVAAFERGLAGRFGSVSRSVKRVASAVDQLPTRGGSVAAAPLDSYKPVAVASIPSGAAATNEVHWSLQDTSLAGRSGSKGPLEPEDLLTVSPAATTVLEIQVVTPGP